jgi:hypothetical protein
MASEHADLRERIIKAGGIMPVIKNLGSNVSMSDELIQTLCFCMSNLLRGDDPPVGEAVRLGLLPALRIHMNNEVCK